MLIIHLKCKLLKYTHSKEEIGRIHVFFFNHPTICCLQETHFKFNNDISLKRMRQWPTACEKAFDGSSRPGRRFTTARGSAASGKAEMKNAATPRAGEDAERRDRPPTPLAAGGGGKRRRPAVSCGTEPAAAGHAAQRSRSRRWPQQWKPRARRDRDVRARDSLPPGDGHALGRRVTPRPSAARRGARRARPRTSVRPVQCVSVRISLATLCCDHWGTPGRGHAGPLRAASYDCV